MTLKKVLEIIQGLSIKIMAITTARVTTRVSVRVGTMLGEVSNIDNVVGGVRITFAMPWQISQCLVEPRGAQVFGGFAFVHNTSKSLAVWVPVAGLCTLHSAH